MEYREHRAGGRLAAAVHCIWTLRGEAGDAERIVPDGRPEIVFNLADPFERRHVDGVIERQPLALMVGQTLGPVHIRPTGAVDLVGIRFQPHGAAAFLDVPLDRVTGSIAAAADVDPWWECVRQRVGNASPAARTGLVCALLEHRIRDRSLDPRLSAATAAITGSQGRRSIDEIAGSLGVSRRQLERLFLRDVGIGPKLLARIHRFQALLRLAQRPRPDTWAALAARLGFADQSHMIREVRTFGGETPTAFVDFSAGPPALFLDG